MVYNIKVNCNDLADCAFQTRRTRSGPQTLISEIRDAFDCRRADPDPLLWPHGPQRLGFC
jgi:hypothetical protein